MRSNLEKAEEQTGKELIPQTDPPECAEYLLGWFWDISKGRGQGFSGQPPLSSQEIKAWAELSGIKLEPFEFAAIRDMDRAFIETVAKINK